jgi:hypothetical protein
MAWLGLVSIRFESWHFEFFPAPFLLVGWNILNVCGNPPNVAAGVFDAAIPLTGRQRHHWKNRNSAGAERAMKTASQSATYR